MTQEQQRIIFDIREHKTEARKLIELYREATETSEAMKADIGRQVKAYKRTIALLFGAWFACN